MKAEVIELELEDAEYIRDHLRPADKKELELYGFRTPEEWCRKTPEADMWCGKIDGVPVCAFGVWYTGWTVQFAFFGTDIIDQHPLKFTRAAKCYIESQMQRYFPARGTVLVWEGHTHSRKWLKMLGFKDTGYTTVKNGGRFILVEKKNV